MNYNPENGFNPSLPVVARKAFSANGRRYAPGDKFDWEHAAVDKRRVGMMFAVGKVMHPEAAAPEPEQALSDLDESNEYWEKPDTYNLEEIGDMNELRRIADEIGAPYKVSKADQRKAIHDHLKEND